MVKQRGATVIGTVSTAEKAQVASEAGADHLILSTSTDFETETMRLTNDQGVHAVYDSVGGTTLCTAERAVCAVRVHTITCSQRQFQA